MERRILSLRGILLLIILSLFACTKGEPELIVKGAILIPSPKMKGVASSFMFIINEGNGGDKLLGCSIKEYPTVRGELHDVVKGKMKRVNEIPIPPGQTTALKAGGLHLMFFGMPDSLPEEVTVLLRFEKSGTIEVKTQVGTL